MKRKFTAFIIAVVLCIACIPLFAGCNGKVGFTLQEDEEGKYYVASVSGYAGGVKGDLIIPEEKDGIPVKEIAQEGFAGCDLTSVTIPKSVKKIGIAAFAYNYTLQKVTFAEGCQIEEISQGMFGYCNAITEISVPDSVTSIGPMAFLNCISLNSVTANSVQSIGYQAFAGCTALKGITLPQTLTTIGEKAFYTSGLTGIVIPDNVHDIESDVLDENGQPKLDDKGNKITKITYGIGLGAFHTCVDLKYAVVGKSVQTLRSGAFGYCPAMEKVYLPKSLKSIEGIYTENGKVPYKHAFQNCGALAEVYYEGTEEEWQALLKNVNNEPYTEKGERYDNSALINAHKNYNQAGLPE